MSSPDSGPAIQTSEMRDFVRPSCRRYGVQYVVSMPQVNLVDSIVSYGWHDDVESE